MSQTRYDQQFKVASAVGADSRQVVARYAKLSPVYNQAVTDWGYQCPEVAAQYMQQYVSLNSKVLDAGCGTGMTGEILAELGYTHIVGLDISPEALALAEQTGAYQEVHLQDMLRIPYPFADNAFAAVECVGVLTFIEDPFPVLAEFCRLVKRGGHLIFTQRDDLYQKHDYASALEQLETKGLARCLVKSDPQPYLPLHKDYGNQIGVFYFVYEVLPVHFHPTQAQSFDKTEAILTNVS
ncbi:class I SAM-dependent methyltransferase [Chloroflexi bacterium TSY]|nr:class I SAM-dependent methyltransferase [Chloroflexi bacterium TSY]